MARGKRTSLADLVSEVEDDSPAGVEIEDVSSTTIAPTAAVLVDLIANPHNPRSVIGDVSDLASIAEMQLQPAVVVTRAAYLRLWPGEELGSAKWVVVNGCRRLKAAGEFGRVDLEIIVKDELARDRATLRAASIRENVDREDLDVIDEAHAVEALIDDCGGRKDMAAARLCKSPGWVSQRLSLLRLAPELQEKVRAGEIAVRVARSLARVPMENQVSAWLAAQDRDASRDKSETPRPRDSGERRRGVGTVTKALRSFDKEPAVLASALREYLGDDGIRILRDALAGDLSR